MNSKPKITICMGSSCFARGNEKNLAFCEEFLNDRGLQDDVDLELGGCLCTGNCSNGPIVIVNGKIFKQVDTGVIGDILKETFPL